MSLSEKLIFVDIVLSYELFRGNSLANKFNVDDCFNEVTNICSSVYVFAERYGSFFMSMYDDICDIISDKKKFKTDFRLGLGLLDSAVYLNCLIRSIHFINEFPSDESIDDEDNMLHRSVVVSNISNYSRVFCLIQKGSNMKANCVKLMILLDKQLCKKKIKFTVRRGVKGISEFKTEVYIKFNILEPLSYKDKMTLVYGVKGFMHIRGFLLCSSHLTLCEVIKRCSYQHFKNEIDHKACLELANKQINIDGCH